MNNHQAENEAIGAVAVHATVLPAASQLITLDPIKYVAEVFKPFSDKFEILKAEADAITPDASTPAGMESAVRYRAAFRDDIRIAGEKARAARKAPILEIGKLLDSRYKDLVAIVEPYEAKFHDAIKAEEKRKEDAKKAEAARQDEIRQRLVAIRELPLQAIGKTSAEIAAMLIALDADEPTEDFGALLDAAKAAHSDAMAKLISAQASAVAVEAEAARIAAERIELQQLREAAAERARLAQAEVDRIAAEQKAEADRLAAVAAEQEAASLREREVAAAKMKAEADAQAEKNRIAQAEIDRQLAELIAAKAAAENAKPTVLESVASPACADVQQNLLVLSADTVSINTTPAAVEVQQIAHAAPTAVPTLTLGKIGTRLGFNLSADFLRNLGFEPAAKERSAILYHEKDWESICAALIRHINLVKVPQQQAA
ncbi:hypothetical protein [Undibacterium sp. TJN19]|uniref:hypothetical protein n=1 Tax=Undibacterium sp. TJN19 TaxID=3413055 RepID=UPI003BEFC6F3